MTSPRTSVRVKRVYDAPDSADGFRILVDRLWPRGLTRDRARVDLWLKDVAPSTPLRQWYHKNTDRWTEFRERYEQELENNPALVLLRNLVREHAKAGSEGVTLLYAAKDIDQNHATLLQQRLQTRRGSTKT